MKALCLALAVGMGCGGPQKAAPPENVEAETPPPAVAEEPPSEVERTDRQTVELAIKIVRDMAAAAANAGGNCDQMSQQLSALAIANRDVFEQMDAIAADEARAAVMQEYASQLESARTLLAARMEACGDDPGVRSAMEAMTP